MQPDLTAFSRLKTKRDFDIEAENLDIQRALKEAEIRKAQMLDIDAMGEQAFFKAAQGLPLTAAEQAAAQFVDAKSGGTSFNPVTGELVQKPRISDKIGLGGIAQPNYQAQSGYSEELPPRGTFASPDEFKDIQAIDESALYGAMPKTAAQMPNSPLMPQSRYLNPKTAMEKSRQELEAGMKEVTALRDAANTSSKAASTAGRIKSLSERSGYTGFGGGAVGMADKALTGLGMPNVISGDVAAREALAKESVDAWVSSVEPLKGALSNTEGNRFDAVTPGLSMTKEGIALMEKMGAAMAKRANQKAAYFSEYYNRTGTTTGAAEAWDKWASQNPVITDSLISGGKQGKSKLGKAEISETLFNARKAVKAGKNPDAIRQRLIEAGIDPAKAGL